MFVDRDGRLFEPILNYMRTGNWRIPAGVDASDVAHEMDFYGLSEDRPLLSDSLLQETYLKTHEEALQRVFEVLTRKFVKTAKKGTHPPSVVFLPSTVPKRPGYKETQEALHASMMTWIENILNKAPVADDEALKALSVPPVQAGLVEQLARQSLSVSVSTFVVERNASDGAWVQKIGLLGSPLVTGQEISWKFHK
jgi:hypothetical protein